jgi:hypothetical protein
VSVDRAMPDQRDLTMTAHDLKGRELRRGAVALAFLAWPLGLAWAKADDGVVVPSSPHGPGIPVAGTLGDGPPAISAGFQGFGLGYHLGYGYGGNALGVGADGGYPFYGGPGYPHPGPCLRRLCGINPFPYFGGPGYPTPEEPHYFGGIGPLVPDRPVVILEIDPRMPFSPSAYGPFTGAVPDAEARFSPVTAQAAAGVSTMRAASPTIPAPMPPPTVPGIRPPAP